jgi:hypothetical protein
MKLSILNKDESFSHTTSMSFPNHIFGKGIMVANIFLHMQTLLM